MSSNSRPIPVLDRLDRLVQSFQSVIALHGVTLALLVLSLVALLIWDSRYESASETRLRAQVIQTDDALTPAQALERLSDAPFVYRYETALDEAPVWLFTRAVARDRTDLALEFPSRHTKSLQCWDGQTLEVIGNASRARQTGQLFAVKAGYALRLEGVTDVLCRITTVGPARVSVAQWTLPQLALAEDHYHRKSGLLDGGLVVLAMFVAMIALTNRDRLYMLFALWLLLNLRVGALSAGWDTQWLGQRVPEEWLLPLRTVTIGLYALVTLELFLRLFRNELATVRFSVPVKAVYWLCGPLLLAAIVLPFRHFLPVMWVLVGFGVFVMLGALARILARSGSSVATCFAAAFSVMCLSTLSEVIAAALGVRAPTEIINSVTAAFASSILVALAVSARMRQEHADRLSAQAQLQHTYEVMPVGLFTLDTSGRLVRANPAFYSILGQDFSELQGEGWMQYFRPGTWTALHELVHREPNGELNICSMQGERRFHVRAALSGGKIEGFLHDVTEQAKATEHLQFMAQNDPLTRALNRRGIETAYDRAVDELGYGKTAALAYLDLDRFKLINDLFGHRAGDEVLKQVCERVSSVLAANHRLGRVGGDEFVIVMPDTAMPLAALICRAAVTNICKSPYVVGDKAFYVRASVGLIEVTPGMPMKDALAAADRACRDAKSGRGDGLVSYDDTTSALKERHAQLALMERLAREDATSRLFLEMQPILSLHEPHASHNFEVLLRMRGEDGSVIPAGRVIEAAESAGLMGLIDRWVLSTTLQWIEDHVGDLANTRFICMNLSGTSLNDERFIQDALEMLEEYPVGASYLCVEITESVALHDLDNTRRFINQIRACGVRVALDDFGAGYSSFSYLKELPADVLKIDGRFVRSINTHPANLAIVEAIVNLARNLGMKTIAEWAEDAETVRTLAELRADYVQGYVIARPQAPERIALARSAASFISDEAMLRLLAELDLDGQLLD